MDVGAGNAKCGKCDSQREREYEWEYLYTRASVNIIFVLCNKNYVS
jgi:hypothetical protein